MENEKTILSDGTMGPWVITFQNMTPRQRLVCTVLVAMELKKETFASIARRHKLSRGYLPAVLRGQLPLTLNVIRAFENELGLNLYPLVAEIPKDDVRAKLKTEKGEII